MLSDFVDNVSLNPWPHQKRERTLQNLSCMNVSLVCIYCLYVEISFTYISLYANILRSKVTWEKY